MVPVTGLEPAEVVGVENFLPQLAPKASAFTSFATPAHSSAPECRFRHTLGRVRSSQIKAVPKVSPPFWFELSEAADASLLGVSAVSSSASRRMNHLPPLSWNIFDTPSLAESVAISFCPPTEKPAAFTRGSRSRVFLPSPFCSMYCFTNMAVSYNIPDLGALRVTA